MRIIATSDLHYNVRRSRAPTEALADEVCRRGGDVLILAGDSAGADYGHLEKLFALFEDFPGKRLAVAGNHELWTLGNGDSLHRYENELPELCSRHGCHTVRESCWRSRAGMRGLPQCQRPRKDLRYGSGELLAFSRGDEGFATVPAWRGDGPNPYNAGLRRSAPPGRRACPFGQASMGSDSRSALHAHGVNSPNRIAGLGKFPNRIACRESSPHCIARFAGRPYGRPRRPPCNGTPSGPRPAS